MSSPKDSAQRRAGEYLRDVRVAAGITQEGLAALMRDRGFKWIQTTATKTEAGTRPLLLDEFVALCDALRLDNPGLILTMVLGPQIKREVRLAELRARIMAAERELDDAQAIAMVRREQLLELHERLEHLEADAS